MTSPRKSQSPRFGSRCFVPRTREGLKRAVQFVWVAIPSVRVSVFRRRAVRSSPRRRCTPVPSQSPRFGSRCFVPPGRAAAAAVRPVLASQSPRFGSRCFVLGYRFYGPAYIDDRRNPLGSGLGVSSLRMTLDMVDSTQVAIPSVRVSVFRQARKHERRWANGQAGRNPLGSGLGVSSRPPRLVPSGKPLTRRNPLGSGLGVSSLECLGDARRVDPEDVAIPSVRVSVFRRANGQAAGGGALGGGAGRNPLGSGLGVSSRS